jgi:hypothetical protein
MRIASLNELQVEIIQMHVTLNSEARALYDEVQELARNRVQDIIRSSGGLTRSVNCRRPYTSDICSFAC